MKTAIIYVSVHHNNTKKLLEAIAENLEIDLIDIKRDRHVSLLGYDRIGFASGVYYQKMHKDLVKFVKKCDFREGQRVFLIATCGIIFGDYTKEVKKILKAKRIPVLGSYQCRGFDTFGPFEKIGGIAKGHPNEKDIRKGKEIIKKWIQ